MSNLDLGVIGNCTFGALVDRKARVVWCCFPRFDGDPVFCSLLNDHTGDGDEVDESAVGIFDVSVDGFVRSEQHYLQNSAILITSLHDKDDAALEVADFAPRFKRLDRTFRPMTMVRHVRPIRGHPRVRVRLRPVGGYGSEQPQRTRGSNHIRYVFPDFTLRCTTDAPVTYITNETSFVLEEPFTIIFGADESLTSSIDETSRQFFRRTLEYWREWSRYLAVPFEWQEAVIRAAITLKLCSFEESGAIIAAMTTSIPEAPHTRRNWDYRYCWLRDAYFVVQALNRLGATRTMEEHLNYITNVVAGAENGHLQPVYGVALDARLIEEEVPSLAGYRSMGPVRKGTQAYEHIQHDVYGSVILAATQSFFDERLARPGDLRLFQRLEEVGYRALDVFDKPDAGAVGAAHQGARAHLFQRHVLGGRRPACAHRHPPRHDRAGEFLARARRRDARTHPGGGVRRKAQHPGRKLRGQGDRRQPSSLVRAALHRCLGSPLPGHRQRDRAPVAARQTHAPLRPRRRFRPPGNTPSTSVRFGTSIP